MTTPVYPDNLPGVSEFQFSPTNQLTRTDIPMAIQRSHRISQVPGAQASAVWQFTGTQYQQFMTWWREDLLEGHKWFKIQLPSAVGLKYTIARFLTHRETQTKGYKAWTVSATLEILERRIRPEVTEQILTTTLYPILDQALLKSTFDVFGGQLSPPIEVVETLGPSLSIITGEMNDLVVNGYDTEELTSSLSVLSGILREIYHSTNLDPDNLTTEFSVINGSINTILITNDIPPESINAEFGVLNGSLT